MNNSEIMEEAKRRVSNMSDKEKRDIWDFSKEDNDFIDYLMDVGVSNLKPNEKRKFRDIVMKHTIQKKPNGIIQAGIEYQLKNDFNITVEDMKKGAKNPFKAKIFKDIVLAAILGLAGAGLAVGGVAPAAVVLEAATGVFAMDFSRQLSNYNNYKKIQKLYMSGEMDEKLIQAEVKQQLFEERKQRWSK